MKKKLRERESACVCERERGERVSERKERRERDNRKNSNDRFCNSIV